MSIDYVAANYIKLDGIKLELLATFSFEGRMYYKVKEEKMPDGTAFGVPVVPNGLINTLNEYQNEALRTRVEATASSVQYSALGLAGEAGEVANKVKKIYRDFDGNIDPECAKSIIMELGDVLWYVSDLAEKLGYSLQVVAEKNIEKLRVRASVGKVVGSGDNR